MSLAVSKPVPSKLADKQNARPTALTLDAQTITDVCSGEELPEVEIISLLEEQIPKYKLRADTLTSFSGYENDDWYCPSLKPEDVSPLTPEQIRETLNYFYLLTPTLRLPYRCRQVTPTLPLGCRGHDLPCRWPRMSSGCIQMPLSFLSVFRNGVVSLCLSAWNCWPNMEPPKEFCICSRESCGLDL
ncbi:trafficking kinesin-binding protein 1 isoform X2 [Halyomorpha halys]|uniref:trafficking kinesin-binding protein 1 isoform X2 n=1 Tax=Halyomorpha halys TaxID=286706 RepID=UPI0006D523D6|nr:trafficking kinesin-binding protein 1-like isoform X2 [Halyomorpha halys]